MSILLLLHSLLRWVILILLLAAIVQSYSGMSSGRPFSNGDRKLGLFLMISAHITLLIGIYQWIVGGFGLKSIQNNGFKTVMENASLRFWAVEHTTGMLLAIIFITIGRGAIKRGSNTSAHNKAAWLFLLALIFILASIPWPFRVGIGRPLFPGM